MSILILSHDLCCCYQCRMANACYVYSFPLSIQ